MALYVMLPPYHRSTQIARNMYLDDEAVECEDLDDQLTLV